MRCFAYIGRPAQEDTTSITAAEKSVADYYVKALKPLGFELAGVYYDNHDAGNPTIRERGAGRSMNLALRRGDFVVIPSVAASFKNDTDVAATLRVWGDRGIGVCVLDVFCTDGSPMTTLTKHGREMVAAYEPLVAMRRSFHAERLKRGQKTKQKTGKLLHGGLPLGYRFAGRKSHRRLEPDADERALMVHIITKRYEGQTFESIYFDLLQRRITCRGKEVALTNVRRLFSAGIKLFASRKAEGATECGGIQEAPTEP